MTKEAAALKLAKMQNLQNDPEQERLNILEYYQRSPNAAPDVLDRLQLEAMQELIDTIARGDAA